MNELLRNVLQDGAVHVWKVCIQNPPLVPDMRILNTHEIKRHTKICTQRMRDVYLLNKFAIRLVLCKYLTNNPWDIILDYLQDGRTVLLNPELVQLNISISTTFDTLFIALSTGLVGIDTELLDQKLCSSELSENAMLAKEESAFLRILPRQTQEALFLNLWVLKESFSKAVGMGLYMDFSTFSVLPQLFTDRVFKHNDKEWYYKCFTVDGKFLIAVILDKNIFRFPFKFITMKFI